MTTIPGFSGYKFDSSNIKKIEGIKKKYRYSKIYVDGGITNIEYDQLNNLGIHTVVIGSYLAKNSPRAIYNLEGKIKFDCKLLGISENFMHLPHTSNLELRDVLNKMIQFKSNYLIYSKNLKNINGIITDGDLKRQIFENLKNIKKILIKPKKNFLFLRETDNYYKIFQLSLNDRKYGAIPLLGSDKKFVNAIELNKIFK